MSVRRAFIALTAGQLLAIVCAYATHVTLARLLGASDYGDYGVILNALATVHVVLTAGLPEAIAKVIARRPEVTSALTYVTLRLQARVALPLGIGYALAAPLLARVFKDPAITGSLALSALSIPGVAIVAVAQGTLNGQRRIWAQGVLYGGGALLRCAAVITLTYFYRVPGAAVGLAVAPTIVALASLPALKPRSEPGVADPKELSQFARPVVIFTVTLALLMSLDLFAVKAAGMSAELIGLYAAASQIAKMPYQVLSGLGVVLLPALSSADAASEGARATLRGAVRGSLLGSLVVAGALVPLSSAVLRTLYGSAFVGAALPLALLLISGTLFTLFFVVSYALYGGDDPKTPMKLTLAGLVLELALLVPGIRFFGMGGAAGVSVVTAGALFAAALVAAKKPFGTIVSLGTLLRSAVAFALTVALGLELTNGTFLSLFLGPVLAIVNLALLLLMRETSMPELVALLRRTPVARSTAEAAES